MDNPEPESFEDFLDRVASDPDTSTSTDTNVLPFHRVCDVCPCPQHCKTRKVCKQQQLDHGFCA